MANAASSVERRTSGWIAGAGVDLAFFIATPLLVIPLIYAARTRFSAESIALYVTAFGATGHHLPGLLRAYGDRDLFTRYRLRFILAPLCLVSACVAFSYWNLRALVLAGITWGVWHSLMQVYGFLRIYDGKARCHDAWTARLDFLMCLSWFLSGLLSSPGRKAHWLDTFFRSGGILVSGEWLNWAFALAAAITGVVTVAYLLNLVRLRRAGMPVSMIKLATLASSIGCWWFAMVLVDNPLLSAALFEVFHDVQYLAIVWIFNRGRVVKNENVGSFTAFLFRRSPAMIALYLALVLGYGIIGLAPDLTDWPDLKTGLYGFLVASGLLHFYYDGFIWKVRDSSTRRALNLSEDAAAPAWNRVPLGLGHAAKWALFLIPVAWLTVAQLRDRTPRLEQLSRLAAAVPDSWNAHLMLGTELQAAGNPEAALKEYERAARLNPRQSAVHHTLGLMYRNRGDSQLALHHLRRAVELNPRSDEALAACCELLVEEQLFPEAEKQLRRLLARSTETAAIRNLLGTTFAAQGKLDEAVEQFDAALALDSQAAGVHNNRGLMLMKLGQFQDAETAFQKAVQLDPEHAEAHNNLGVLYFQRKDPRRAIEHYRLAVEADREMHRAVHSLAWNLATCPDDSLRGGAEAVRLAQSLTQTVDAGHPGYWSTLAAAYAEVGRFDDAITAANHALKLARPRGDRGAMQLASLGLERYRRQLAYRDGER